MSKATASLNFLFQLFTPLTAYRTELRITETSSNTLGQDRGPYGRESLPSLGILSFANIPTNAANFGCRRQHHRRRGRRVAARTRAARAPRGIVRLLQSKEREVRLAAVAERRRGRRAARSSSSRRSCVAGSLRPDPLPQNTPCFGVGERSHVSLNFLLSTLHTSHRLPVPSCELPRRAPTSCTYLTCEPTLSDERDHLPSTSPCSWPPPPRRQRAPSTRARRPRASPPPARAQLRELHGGRRRLDGDVVHAGLQRNPSATTRWWASA